MVAAAQTKTGTTSLYIVFGEDEHARRRKAAELVQRLCPPAEQAFGLEVIEGDADSVAEGIDLVGRCISALRTVGFLGGGKLVWLREAGFLVQSRRSTEEDDPAEEEADGVSGQDGNSLKGALERLLTLIEKGLPAGQTLLITAPRITKTLSFYKRSVKLGEVHEFAVAGKPHEQGRQAAERAQEMLQEAGIKFDRNTLTLFAARTGMHTLQMAQDVEKIRLYLGAGGRLTAEVVDLLVPPTQETMVWDLSGALGNRQMGEAMRVLRCLYAQRQNPIGLFIMLERHLTKLLLLSRCLERGWARLESDYRRENLVWEADDEAEKLLATLGKDDPRKGHPYVQLLAAKQAMLFGRSRVLVRARERLLAGRKAAVTGVLPDELALELALIEIIGGSGRGT